MEIRHTTSQKLDHQFMLSEEMQYGLRVLFMSAVSLREHIQEEFLCNPLLEMEDISQEEQLDTPDDSSEVLSKEDYCERSHRQNGEELYSLDYIANRKTLREDLADQINTMEFNEEIKRAALYIISSLDNGGFFVDGIENVSKALGVSHKTAKEALFQVQKLEPQGVGCSGVVDFILFQLKQKGKDTTPYEQLIGCYLKELANGNIRKISQEMGFSQEFIRELIHQIKSVRFLPSMGYLTEDENISFIPDVEVREEDNKLVLHRVQWKLPKLILNTGLAKAQVDTDLKAYLLEHYRKGEQLIKSLEMRKSTLEKVSLILIRRQEEYLLGKSEFLKSLSIKQIAEILGVHESTVSRTVNEKYMKTPRGIIQLKNLLSGTVNNDAKEYSKSQVECAILKIIREEDSSKPHSDQNITDILNKNGILIKRRTVSKYREEAGIQSAKLRRL